MRFAILLVALGLTFATVGRAVAQPIAPTPQLQAGEIIVERASLAVLGGREMEYEIGTLYVPENRANPNSRLIGVGFARFRTADKSNSPAIFMLPGGPGESYLTRLKDNPQRSSLLERIQRCREFADVILVDQRGFSERGDVLKYSYHRKAEPLEEPASLKRSTDVYTDLARAAVAHFEAKGFDLKGYTIKECADDVDDLRQALGYDTITLTGGSFGSQWSFAVMRRHPSRVARALLSGVEPLDCAYDMPSHVSAAIQRMWRDAERDARLRLYLPPGGLNEAAQTVLKRLGRGPISVSVRGVAITLGIEDFRRSPLLRSPAGPAFVLSLYYKEYDQWALMTLQARRGRMANFPVLAALVDTSLGATPERRYLLENDPATSLLGKWNFDRQFATAEIWPSPGVGDDFRAEVDCRIPIVFVHGDWDTQTPIENTLQIVPYFRKGRVLIVERGGHGALGQVDKHSPDTAAALDAFLKTGEVEQVPTRVEIPVPKFDSPSFPAFKR